MIHLLAVIGLILTCGIADRLIGWGEWGRTKPVLLTVALLVLCAFGFDLPWQSAVAFPVAFLIWRTPEWALFGGSINPKPNKAFGTFLRHLLSLAFLIPAYLAGVPLLPVALCMAVFAASGTLLAIWNYYKEAHINHTIEAIRGLTLGALLALAFAYRRKPAATFNRYLPEGFRRKLETATRAAQAQK